KSAAAQKKYRLFGKGKTGDMSKNSSHVQSYYADYSYMYSNPCQLNGNENYNQATDYYSATVVHNHTYAQPSELAPLNSISRSEVDRDPEEVSTVRERKNR